MKRCGDFAKNLIECGFVLISSKDLLTKKFKRRVKISYAPVGYPGHYLIVLPKKNIVTVRMISAESFRQIPNNPEFSLLRRLAKQL